MGQRTINWPRLFWPFSGGRFNGGQPVTGPWTNASRIAVIGPWFPVSGRAKVYKHIDYDGLTRLKAQVIAAPVPELRRLAADVLSGTVQLQPPERGFLALIGIGREPPTQQDHDMIWLAFKTPLRAEFRSCTGQPLARDCEAYTGLHVVAENAAFAQCRQDGELRVAPTGKKLEAELLSTGMKGQIDTDPCPCGNPAPRLVNLRAVDTIVKSASMSATA